MNLMKFKILSEKFRYISLLLLCVLLAGTMEAQNLKEEKGKHVVTINLKVVDDKGLPLPNAQVVVGEKVIKAESDEKGSVSFKAYMDNYITVTASGYEKSVYAVEGLMADNTIRLVKSKLLMTSDDGIPLPFMTIRKRNNYRKRQCNHR